MLWVVFIVMLFAALTAVALPLYRGRQRTLALLSAFVIVGVAAGLYSNIGTPQADSHPDSQADGQASLQEMVASLEARLVQEPDDLKGWMMLGRSQMQLGDLPKAIAAFERAVEIEGGNNGETLISLGEAMLSYNRDSIAGRAGELFESGLALAPNSPRGLFYGGFSALQRGDQSLAADRWEALLASSPPPEIRGILEQRVAEWRGTAPAATSQPTANSPAVVEPAADRAVIAVDVSFGDSSISAQSSTVFVIARDPQQPSPPLAVVRRTTGDFPGTVEIRDSNAMIAARLPSNYDQLEIVVRVSRSGQPTAQSGDWFGEAVYQRSAGSAVSVTVNQQVP